jgi:2'-5' RNA ligase
VRLFVAIPCPPAHPVATALLTDLPPMSWRLVPPERRHVTLRFLGEVSERRVPSIADGLAKLTGPPAFPLTVQGMGAFPDLHRPDVLWLGCGDGGRSLAQLAESVRSVLGLGPERRDFHGHLTVARRRHERSPAEAAASLEDALPQWRSAFWGTVMVDRLQLFRSDLFPDGPRYAPLATVRLPLP